MSSNQNNPAIICEYRSKKMGLGISILVGLKSLVCFLVFVFLRNHGFSLISIPFFYTSLVSLLVCVASHPSIDLPLLLGKNPDGSFPLWSIIVFSPYLYFVRVFSALRRFVSGEEPYNEICEGLFVGGWPSSEQRIPPGNPAIIDCTCEFPRRDEFRGNAYFCVPTWDTRAPRVHQIESAVKWGCRKRALNVPVFVHCAYGHGRSVAVTCALLVALEVVDDWKMAERYIKQKRPYIRMNALHRKALEEWSQNRVGYPKSRAGIHVNEKRTD
ncbi:PREDICTED: uncharacterized protein LOC104801579 [Tarenaya hassleriana]|uniref:uncharacterized protein LOC104801579 n=1 Tax=Tarenaya hassleriana TaxID=28532 RepID=UPI00053C7B1B|nr:PREDICTED: uncharacterized protein LOC104801579 [Tarenaya hassleriana]XP_010523257.1 PREDICTED: uncharacterized protein LOC104801579 [Tarenaya hassleriana]